MRIQGLGGSIVNIASKNGLVSGPNNAGYGTAKAAQMHSVKTFGSRIASDQIRVNTVNPDGVIVGVKSGKVNGQRGEQKLMVSPWRSCQLLCKEIF